MQNYICVTCGVQYKKSKVEPEQCIVCMDERQYVRVKGQAWTTLEKMIKDNCYQNEITRDEKNLHSLTTTPSFGIGQTAYLIQSYGFNLLWDCLTFIDEKTIYEIKKLGGIHAIALSHPHYYASQVEWAKAFDVPIYIHVDDKEWVMRESDHISYWSGESHELTKGISLHRLGGHFKGGTVLEWQEGNAQKGILLTGDIIQVVADRKWVSFMYSYPNLIPLPASKVQDMANRVKELKFDRIYNAFHRVVKEEANLSVQKSAKRYIEALNGNLFST